MPSVSQSRSAISAVLVREDTIADAGKEESAAASEGLTRRRCMRMGAWGDVCVYENLCFDGNVYYFLEEEGGRNITTTRFLEFWSDQVRMTLWHRGLSC
jgi:hypothetical protein